MCYMEKYLSFRKSIEQFGVPSDEGIHIQDIKCDGKTVGLFCAFYDYIDCLYIEPAYRHRGLAKAVASDWVRRYGHLGIRLHILNDKPEALSFWNKLFELKQIETNAVDTLYEITGTRI